MTAWAARVEWAPATDLTDEHFAELAEHLTPYSASVGLEPNGNPSAQLTIEARTLRQAFDGAVRAVEAACKATGIAFALRGAEIITWAEFERREAEPLVPPLVGLTESAQILGVTRQRAATIVEDHDVHVVTRTARGPLFVRAHIERLAKTRPRSAGRPSKSAPQREPIEE
ncbi:hypothetical protein [Spirillospora sp. CA-294931]|uniref:hypothetical protein n=1 Tax=Spirillospora sp. CA-294931 TaxID=3240042 RepID=UPI003D9027EE